MAIVPYMNLEDISSRVLNVHRLFQEQLELISQFTSHEDGGDRLVEFNRDFRVAYYVTTQVSVCPTVPRSSAHCI